MERALLQQAADLLDTLTSGAWLRQQLVEYAPPSQQPHVLVLVSAPRSVSQVFPQGLPLDSTWQVVPEGKELTQAMLEQADLIIWFMTALRLFPGEYALALEQARRQTIPIWAIITGMERLSDENSFLHQRLPKYRASLPADSQFFLFRPTPRIPLHEAVVHALDKQGADLLKQGDERRLNILASRLKEQMSQERQMLSGKLSQAEQFASTASAGVSSLKILTNATANTIVRNYYSLQHTIDMLKNELLEKTAVEGIHEPLDTLPDIFIGAVLRWQKETFEAKLREKRTQAEAQLHAWYEEYTHEIALFFRFSDSLDGAIPSDVPYPPVERWEAYLNDLQKNIFKAFERFLQSFRYSLESVSNAKAELPIMDSTDQEGLPRNEPSSRYATYHDEPSPNTAQSVSFRQKLNRLIDKSRRVLNEWSNPTYDDEQQRQEVLQELVHQHIEWFIGDLLAVVQQQQKPLTMLLEHMQSTWGDQHQERIQATLTTPQQQLALLAEAERLLRGAL